MFNPILSSMATTQIKAESSNSHSPFLSHSRCQWEYQVYMSFRGDTRKGFTDHLYFSLCQVGITTFRDKEEVRKGETLSSEFERAIRGSRISIIVFSKGYASSRWCLNELVEILECKEIKKQVVLPVFYDVDPSEVCKQTGEYGVALARHEERFGEAKVKSWRDALTKVGELSGWDLQEVANGYESEFINAIIEEVLSIVEQVPLFVARYPIGLDSRVEEIVQLMRNDINDDVQFIGIYGMGGIGKTTLVKAVYNHVFKYFDNSCFLEIRPKASDQHNNRIIALQQELLNKILKRKIKVSNVDRGIMLIKERLKARKSLIVLDDLYHLDQLYALAGERNWFGAGSRVILTTRDKHILKDLKVDEWYMVKELNDENSLQLFSLHAFKISKPLEDYTKLSKDIVSYCEGLPLALQVLGVYLANKENGDWRSAIERLKTIPSNGVHEKLKISFDGLSSQFAKDIFLDLACCLPEVIHKQKVISIYDEVPRCFPKIEIQDLIEKSLIIIDEYDCLRMHRLIREMGREIVYFESPNNPGERSRLCCPNEISEVLLRHKGTPKVEGIALERPMQNMSVDTKAFKNMSNLKLLRIDHLHLHGSFKHFSPKLRWLQWNYCPLKYIPSDFHFENLVILKLEKSNIKEFWAPLKYFPSMKSLSFAHSQHLTRTPNFSGAQHLENLSFWGCSRLVDVHSSIGELGRLKKVSFWICVNLKKLPKSFFQLKSLEELYVDFCPKLRLPEELGKLTSLKTLSAGIYPSTMLGSKVHLLSSLKTLSADDYSTFVRFVSYCDCVKLKKHPKRFWQLKSLEILLANRCPKLRLPEESLKRLSAGYHSSTSMSSNVHYLPSLTSLCSLDKLDISGLNFHHVPFSLCHFSMLKCIILDCWKNLEILPPLPPSLQILRAWVCESLEKLSNLSNLKQLQVLDLIGCTNLLEADGLENLDSIKVIHLMNCSRVRKPFTESFFKLGLKEITCADKEVPGWFSFQEVGSSISFQLPLYKKHNNELEFLVLIVWLVWEPTSKYNRFRKSPMIRPNGTTSSIRFLTLDHITSMGMIDRSEKTVKVDVIDVDEAILVKKIGVHALYLTNAEFEGDEATSTEFSEKHAYPFTKELTLGYYEYCSKIKLHVK